MANREDRDFSAFKPLQEKSVRVDLSNCRYLGELHQVLKTKFDHYGENRSALWDHLDGLFEDDGEIEIEVWGYYDMSDEMQKGCEPMRRIFDRAAQTMPNVHVVYD